MNYFKNPKKFFLLLLVFTLLLPPKTNSGNEHLFTTYEIQDSHPEIK